LDLPRETKLEEASDRDLVAAHLAGDGGAAYTVLYRRHRDRVFAVCLGLTGDQDRAADVTQEVFVRLVTRLGSFDGRAAFTTWLHRVTVNACYDDLRRHRPIPVEDPSAEGDRSGVAPPDVAARLDLLAALQSLGEDQRTAVVLHDVEGFEYHEIAEVTGVPIGTVKSRIARGRLRLASILGPGNTEAGPDRLTGVPDDRS
jgi:RNA polymerase sigma-70 factor (ECF subfamily)